MALAGTIIGAIVTVLLPILAIVAAILIPNFIHAREMARQANCLNNVRELYIAAQLYADDHDDCFPIAETWNDSLKPYLKNPDAFICPVVESKEPSYAINNQLTGFREGDVQMAADTVVLFESIPGNNRSGGPESLLSSPRHPQGNTIGFVDGHVKSVQTSETSNLNWYPLVTIPSY